MIDLVTLSLTLSGTSGNVTSGSAVMGRILAIYLEYQSGTDAGTDVTIATAASSSLPANTILTITDSATSGWYYPRHQVHSNAGAALTLDGTRANVDTVPVYDKLKISVAQSTTAKTITAYILYER